jgi:Flp pilus assembly protein TadD
MSLVLGIVLAVLLGVGIGILLARLRARRQTAGAAPRDLQGVLQAYRQARYDEVIEAAPGVLSDMDATTRATWRPRLELVWGHALFELDRYAEAIPHLRRGLEDGEGPREAEARFRHCLGYALHQTGDDAGARAVYTALLDDDDLDPTVRAGVERNLAELN